MATPFRPLTVNLREDQYQKIEELAMERFEGKMAQALRFMVDQWFKWEEIRIAKKIRKEHERAT